MTKKEQLQREILEKVKPGTKPSHLKKLKRSRSESDIPKAPPLPKTELSETEQLKKQTDLTNLLQEQLKEKQSEIEALRQQAEDATKQIENLRQQLEAKNSSPELTTELDQNLITRHKSLKDWFIQYSQKKI